MSAFTSSLEFGVKLSLLRSIIACALEQLVANTRREFQCSILIDGGGDAWIFPLVFAEP